jgi:hypothetical protein
MKFLKFLTFGLLVGLLTSCSQGRLIQFLGAGEVSPGAFSTEIPFERTLGLIIIEAQIDGATYRFLLDSGAPNILDQGLASRLGIAGKKKWKVTDGAGNTQKLSFVLVDSVVIGGINFGQTAAAIADLKQVPELKCLDIDGFIGANLMRLATWQVDFQQERIHIASARDSLPVTEGGIEVPFVMTPQGTPYIQIIGDQDTFPRMTLDLGSNSCLEAPRQFYYSRKQKNKAVQSFGANEANLYGKTADTSYLSFFQEVQLGDSLLGSYPVSFEGEDKEGYIGTDFLESFLLTIDWKKRVVVLDPRERTQEVSLWTFGFSASFEAGQLQVTALIHDGPADKAGLQIGDRILFMNGQDFINFNESAYCRFFRSQLIKTEWEDLDMMVEQDGATRRLNLKRTDLFEE